MMFNIASRVGTPNWHEAQVSVLVVDAPDSSSAPDFCIAKYDLNLEGPSKKDIVSLARV